MAGFDRFGKVWAANGLLDDATDLEANQGWLYIGQAPPSVEQFNSTHRWWDEKDNWLYGQIANVIWDAQLVPVANDLTTLLQALTKKLAAYVLKIGDTMTGALTMASGPNGIVWNPPGAIPYGAWLQSKMGFGWDGSKLRVKVDGTDVGSIALNYVPGDYVIKTGDTMSGTLINQQTVQANYLLSMGDITASRNLVGNWIHSNGDMTAAGSFAANWIHSYTDVIADGSVHSNYIHSYGNVRADNYLDGQNLTVAGNSGLHYTHIYSNLDVDGTVGAGAFSTGGTISGGNINASGSIGVAGNISANGSVTAANVTATNHVEGVSIHASGDMRAEGNFFANVVQGNSIQSYGDISAGTRILARDRMLVVTPGPNPAYVIWNTAAGVAVGKYVDAGGAHWNGTDGSGNPSTGALMTLTMGGVLFTAGGVGTPSDHRLKTNIRDAVDYDALAAIRKIKFHSYEFNNRNIDFGLLADDVKPELPGAILPPPEGEDTLYFDHMALITYAYKAIAQLGLQVDNLEQRMK